MNLSDPQPSPGPLTTAEVQEGRSRVARFLTADAAPPPSRDWSSAKIDAECWLLRNASRLLDAADVALNSAGVVAIAEREAARLREECDGLRRLCGIAADELRWSLATEHQMLVRRLRSASSGEETGGKGGGG